MIILETNRLILRTWEEQDIELMAAIDQDPTHGSVRELFAIISSFYNYLLQEEYVTMNPVAIIRQKSKFIRKTQGQPKIRRLSELQWQYVIKTAKELAEKDADVHERKQPYIGYVIPVFLMMLK